MDHIASGVAVNTGHQNGDLMIRSKGHDLGPFQIDGSNGSVNPVGTGNLCSEFNGCQVVSSQIHRAGVEDRRLLLSIDGAFRGGVELLKVLGNRNLLAKFFTVVIQQVDHTGGNPFDARVGIVGEGVAVTVVVHQEIKGDHFDLHVWISNKLTIGDDDLSDFMIVINQSQIAHTLLSFNKRIEVSVVVEAETHSSDLWELAWGRTR